MPTDPTQEFVIAEWDEPLRTTPVITKSQIASIISLALVAAAALAVIGWFLKESTLYFASATAVVAALAYTVQQRQPAQSSHIILTNIQLVVGKQTYSLADLAGFWLDRDGDLVVINVERVKSTMFPITFFSGSSSSEQTREQLLQILPEVEPRQPSSFNQLLRR